MTHAVDSGASNLEAPSARAPVDVRELRGPFERAGYVVIPEVVPTEKLGELARTLRDEFDRTTRSGRLFSGGGRISGHLNCFPGEQSRFVLDALRERGITGAIRELAPKATGAPFVGCNLNLPGSVAQHYHMDGTFTTEFVIANVAVVDTDLENGAIDLLPGTHARFYEFWRYAAHRLYRRSTRIPMKQGDVLLRRSTVWHRGMPNRARAARPMIAITFGEYRDEPDDDDPFRFNDGKVLFRENWYRTTFLGQLRERTFVAAPLSYSAYRFARSLVGNKGYAP